MAPHPSTGDIPRRRRPATITPALWPRRAPGSSAASAWCQATFSKPRDRPISRRPVTGADARGEPFHGGLLRHRLPVLRPQRRSDCATGVRPCPFAACRYHLLVDALADGSLSIRSGDQRITIPRSASDAEFSAAVDRAIDSWFDAATPPPTCALDHVGEEHSLAAVGDALAVTREYVRQIESRASTKLLQALAMVGVERTILERGSTGR